MKGVILLSCILTNLGVTKKQADKISKYVVKYSAIHKIDPLLVLSIMQKESRFKMVTNKKTNDYGIMQIHCPDKQYAPWCHNIKKLKKSMGYNIKTGIEIMALHRKRCLKNHGHKSHWVRHYNWGNKKYAEDVFKIMLSFYKIANKCRKEVNK